MNNFNLVTILLLKALLIGAFILLGPIGLGPDEAQYWTWAKQIDWGYYSKPPAIAWQIWSGTYLFGDTELGVRFGAIIIGLALPGAVFLLAKSLTSSNKTALYAALVMALTPLGILASFLAITDTGMTLFWVLACVVIVKAIQEESQPNYLLVGCFIALAALFKWPAYAFWLIILGMYPFYKEIRSRTIIPGILISLLGIIPSLYWNSYHDWASFQHVLATLIGQQVHGGRASTSLNGNFFEFLGAQAALISPILFVVLILSFVATIRKKQPISIQFLVINCFSILLLCLFLSLFKKIQGNWGSYAYPTGVVVLTWFCLERWKNGLRWLQAGLILSVIITCFVLSIPTLQNFGVSIPYKINPFRHNIGWKKLNAALIEKGYNPEKDFLFGDKYQTSSLLHFYGPGQKRSYFLNLHGTRKNQFSYWPSMKEEQIGKTGYFVFYENCEKPQECIDSHKEALKIYFEDVQYLGSVSLFEIGDKPVKNGYIFKGIKYNGKEPEKVDLY